MLKEKAALFTIGQFAALHEINKKTLMWYDEIGLLKPACIKENGYRYYSYQQSAALETILMLRELNVSLDEIKQFMENRTIDNFASLLQEKITELNQTISHLRSIQKILINQQQDMDMLRSLDIAEISLVEKQSRYLVAVDMAENLSFEQEIERVIAETKKHQLRRLHDASYGAMLPVEMCIRDRPTPDRSSPPTALRSPSSPSPEAAAAGPPGPTAWPPGADASF